MTGVCVRSGAILLGVALALSGCRSVEEVSTETGSPAMTTPEPSTPSTRLQPPDGMGRPAPLTSTSTTGSRPDAPPPRPPAPTATTTTASTTVSTAPTDASTPTTTTSVADLTPGTPTSTPTRDGATREVVAFFGAPAMPRPPTTAAEAATAILETEGALRAKDRDLTELAAVAHRQQLTYRRLARHPEWDAEVAAALPSWLDPVVAHHVGARRAFISMGSSRPENVPAWQIVAPEPAPELLGYYREAEERFEVPWEYLAAINLVETAMGRIVGLSTAGARGPMQFLPTTWERFGEGDIDDPRDSIQAAGRFLEHFGFAEDPGAALFRYNNHTAYGEAVTHYAQLMIDDPGVYEALHLWPVQYHARIGDLHLPVGYRESEARPAGEWLAERGWQAR